MSPRSVVGKPGVAVCLLAAATLCWVSSCGEHDEQAAAGALGRGAPSVAPERVQTGPDQSAEGPVAADYGRHVAELSAKLPAGFTVVVQPPFVVLGDESPAVVRQRAERTVKWAVDRLKQDYFEKDPDEILDIWLFKDAASYRLHCRQLFGQTPPTPFGFYSEREKALIMNVATGGGTLVHEIVHPYVRANFPGCPVWFNEGLACLYEQCGERDGHIVGFTNWRLKGLKEAIGNGAVLSFEELARTGDQEFYGERPGIHYAQARYLCYYLQEKGLLRTFYRQFLANRHVDPTGYETLQEVLGEDDMAAFQRRWQAFVLELEFP